MSEIRIADLFAGIGGIRMGMVQALGDAAHVVYSSEWNKYSVQTYEANWHDENPVAGDITKVDEHDVPDIDLLLAGFPCQPFSVAGNRKGTGDDRYLWPEMLGAIREIRPRWVVGENVLGIVDWSEGLVFEQVCSDMENEGYEVQPFVLPACGVNAPHKRNRIWFVAHRADSGSEDMCQREDGLHAFGVYAHAYGIGLREWANEPESVEGRVRAADISACSANGDASDTDSQRREERFTPAESGQKRWRNGENGYAERRIPGWSGFPTQSPVCRRDDGFPGGLDGITFPSWCRESVKAYGNAIVPQVALRIFETINAYEKLSR